MQALVYLGPGRKALQEHAKPDILASTDAIVKISKTTICGTDLHITRTAASIRFRRAPTKKLW
jgi:alcohol dehydrogenase